ncbi:uncharacterized protein V6R79_017431 [Siganus canaliculatus]
MTLVHSLILCLTFKACSLQLHCGKEILNDADFSISVIQTIKMAAGECADIQYSFTFPTDKVTAPYKKIWFRGDPRNIESEEIVDDAELERQNGILEIKALPRGKHEYGLRLEWGCNQTYVFPERIWISVSESTQKPMVIVPPLREGHTVRIECRAPVLCSGKADLSWKWEKREISFGLQRVYYQTSMILVTPRADDHNTKLTCVANYNFCSTQTTVTLAVKFPPKILNASRCTVDGKLLVCMCISWGNPRPPIIWPLTSLTADYSVTSSSSDQTVKSTVTMPAADYHNSSVSCISHNELGDAEMDIPIHSTREASEFQVSLPWIITVVSLSLNGILLTFLIMCTHKRAKSRQMELREEMNTYASLRRDDIEQVYSVISPVNA